MGRDATVGTIATPRAANTVTIHYPSESATDETQIKHGNDHLKSVFRDDFVCLSGFEYGRPAATV
jgi:hypothetical protein